MTSQPDEHQRNSEIKSLPRFEEDVNPLVRTERSGNIR